MSQKLKNKWIYYNRFCAFIISLFISFVIVSASTVPAYSGIFSKLLGSAVSTMANEMFEGIGDIISTGLNDIGDKLVKMTTEGFGPDFSTFDKVMQGKNIGVGKSPSAPQHSYSSQKLMNIAQVFGFSIATILLIFSLVYYFWAPPGEIKDTPIRLLLRYALACFLIYYSAQVMVVFLNIANHLWTEYIIKGVVEDGIKRSVTFKNLTIGSVAEPGEEAKSVVITILGSTIKAGFMTQLPFCVIIPIIIIIASWALIKGFFKFYIEIIERYIVVILLYLFFGAAAATLVSKQSSNVFKSYMRMFACQILILFLNAGFMAIFVDVLIAGGWTCSIANYIFALAYLRVCQRIDSYMAMLGLNVAQTGGQCLDTLAGVGRSLLGGLRTANAARSAGMGALSAAAANRGDFQKAALYSSLSGSREASNVMAQGGITNAGLSMAARTGGKMHLNANEAANVISGYMNNPGNREWADRVKAMDKASQIDGINSILENNGSNFRATGLNDTDIKRGEIGFTGKYLDEDGMLGDTDIDGKLSSSSNNPINEISMANGMPEGVVLSTLNSLKDGEKMEGDCEKLGLATGTSGLLNGADENYRGRIAAMKYDGKSDSFSLYDKNNAQIGTIGKIDGKNMALSQALTKPSTGLAGSENKFINDPGNKKKLEKDNGLVRGSLKMDQGNGLGIMTGNARKIENGKERDVNLKMIDVGAMGMSSLNENGRFKGNITSLENSIGSSDSGSLRNVSGHIATEISKPSGIETAASKMESFSGSRGRGDDSYRSSSQSYRESDTYSSRDGGNAYTSMQSSLPTSGMSATGMGGQPVIINQAPQQLNPATVTSSANGPIPQQSVRVTTSEGGEPSIQRRRSSASGGERKKTVSSDKKR